MALPNDATKDNCSSSSADPKKALLIDLAGAIDKINEILAYLRSEGVFLSSSNVFTADQTIRSTDGGSGIGPTLSLDRASASPAASDSLGAVIFDGRDSDGNAQTYGRIIGFITNPASGAETGGLSFNTAVSGTVASRMTLHSGLVMAGATGGDKGAGTINATAVYDDGVQLHPSGIAKAWALVRSDGTLLASHNVASVTRNSTGNYTVSWGTDFADANYACVASVTKDDDATAVYLLNAQVRNRLAGSVRVLTGNANNGVANDMDFSIVAFGTQ